MSTSTPGISVHALALWITLTLSLGCGANERADATRRLEPTANPDILCRDSSRRVCTWAVMPEAMRLRQAELMFDIARRLERGDAPDAIAATLTGYEDVAHVERSPTHLAFSLEGGVEAIVLLTEPLERAAPTAHALPTREELRQQALVVGREGDLEPRRRARLISPYAQLERDALFAANDEREALLRTLPDYRGQITHWRGASSLVAPDEASIRRHLEAFHDWRDQDLVIALTHGLASERHGLFIMLTGIIAGALNLSEEEDASEAIIRDIARQCDEITLNEPGMLCALGEVVTPRGAAGEQRAFAPMLAISTNYLRAHRSNQLEDTLLMLNTCNSLNAVEDVGDLFKGAPGQRRGAVLGHVDAVEAQVGAQLITSTLRRMSQGASLQEAYLTAPPPGGYISGDEGDEDAPPSTFEYRANQELHLGEVIELFSVHDRARLSSLHPVVIEADAQGRHRHLELGVRLRALTRAVPVHAPHELAPDGASDTLRPLLSGYRTEIWRTDEGGRRLTLLASFSHDPEAHAEDVTVDDWTQEITFTLELDAPIEAEGEALHLAAITTLPHRFHTPLPGEDLTSTHHVTLTTMLGSPCSVTLAHGPAGDTPVQLLASTHGAHVVGQVDLMTHDPAHFWGRLGVSGEHFDFWGETTPGARAPLLGGFSPPDAQVPLGFQEGAFIELLDVTPALGEDGQPLPEEEALRKRYHFHAPLRPVTASVTEPLTGHVEGHLDVITTHDPDHHEAPWGISCDRNLQDF